MNFIVIDLETTGLNFQRDEIIEIGAVKIIDDKITETFQTFVMPNQTLSPEISELTGITDDMLTNAPGLNQAIAALQNFAGDIQHWIAHNKDFESTFLDPLLQIQPRWLDTIDIAKIADPVSRYFRLSYLTENYAIEHNDAHRALGDALATARLFLLLAEKLRGLSDDIWREFAQIAANVNSPLTDLMFYLQNTRKASPIVFTDASLNGWSSADFQGQPDEPDHFYQLPVDKVNNFFDNLPSDRYEKRPEQVKMAQKVADALNRHQVMLIEAGTGTGKSLAYLLPAVLFAKGSHQQVIISTNTINLQEQLLAKDIPLMQNELNTDFSAMVLKGRSNYLCRRKWQYLQNEADVATLPLFLRITHWLRITATGDLSEMNLWDNENEILQRLNAASETCTNFNCRYSHRHCFVTRIRQAAQTSDIIIVNHSLLLSASTTDDECSSVLPCVSNIIIDEAHQLATVAQRQFSEEFSEPKIDSIISKLWHRSHPYEMLQKIKQMPGSAETAKLLENLIDAYREIAPAAHTLTQLTESFYTTHTYAEQRYLRIANQRNQPEIWQPLEDALSNVYFALRQFNRALGNLLSEINDTDDPYFSADTIAAFQSVKARMGTLLLTAQCIIDGRNNETDEDYVIWLERTWQWSNGERREFLQWWAAPSDIRPILNRNLYAAKDSLIFTSATMTNNNFKHFINELGLDQQELPIADCILHSPFDYRHNSLLLLANDIGDYTQTNPFVTLQQLADAIYSLTSAANGRTLVLFTSYQQLNGVYDLLAHKIQDTDIKLLAHGRSGSRSSIIDAMKKNPRSCILGVNSFWEGVDIKGDSLSLLIIVRLPFAPPDSPILEAKFENIKKNGGNPFRDYSLPQAVIRFKQGFGRLIRSNTDHGVCCVLDQRIWNKKSYGKMFINALPEMPTYCCSTDEMAEQIKDFLA